MKCGRVLITGATGMIGNALVGKLRAVGTEVIAVARRANKYVHVDHYWSLGTPIGPSLIGVDSLVHLAARVHVRGKGFSDRQSFLEDNAYSTLLLAKEAYARGVRRFVFVSSIGVLGARSDIPLDETAKPCPHNAYTSSKCVAERLLTEFSRESGLELVILRFPAVVGAGAKGNVASLAEAVRRKVPLPIGNLVNRRQFVALENLVGAILLTLTQEKAAGELFHVANPECVSTLELCELIAAVLEVKLRVWPMPVGLLRAIFIGGGRRSLAEGLTADLLVDVTKVRQILGWAPEQSLEQALRESILSR